MKLKRITEEEIRELLIADCTEKWNEETAREVVEKVTFGFSLKVAQAQLEACEKEASEKVNETLSLVKGYTEMAVREIFEGIRNIFDELYPPPLKEPLLKPLIELWDRLEAYKQSTLKKYGGEK